jgi:hypothetical protein
MIQWSMALWAVKKRSRRCYLLTRALGGWVALNGGFWWRASVLALVCRGSVVVEGGAVTLASQHVVDQGDHQEADDVGDVRDAGVDVGVGVGVEEVVEGTNQESRPYTDRGGCT